MRKRVKEVSGMSNLLFDFCPNRTEAEVYMNRELDVTEFVKFIKKLKKDRPEITFFHGLVMLLGKTIYSRPKMNYYVQNRTLYKNDDVSIAFVAKEKFEDESIELETVIKIGEKDTLLDISDNIYKKVKGMRSHQESGVDGIVEKIGKSPKFIRCTVTTLVKWMDKHGILPGFLRDGNLYYSSAIVSNLGTFKTGAIYHHLTNFGTYSSLITFGEIVEEDGRYYMELGATIDERVADGFYFVKALKLMEYILDNPELLMEPAGKHVTIPENKK